MIRPRFTDAASVDPGRILIGHLSFSGKPRPWIILWMDDEAQCACLTACTTKAAYPGATPTFWPPQPHVFGAFLQPYEVLRGRPLGAKMPRNLLRQLRVNLSEVLDLTEENDHV